MSLILDALQEAEQRRGHRMAPENAAQAAPVAAIVTPKAGHPGLWLLGTGILLATVMGAAWFLWPALGQTGSRVSAESQDRPRPQAVEVQEVMAARPNAATGPIFRPMDAIQPDATRTPDKVSDGAQQAPSTPQQTAPLTPTQRVMPPDVAPQGIPALADLPAQDRAGIPALNITGHTYSDNPTLRTLMVDGRMFVEGQALQPGLRLERIEPHRAVFTHRGTRFAMDY